MTEFHAKFIETTTGSFELPVIISLVLVIYLSCTLQRNLYRL